MTYNFISKDSKVIVILFGKFSPSDYHFVAALKENRGNHRIKLMIACLKLMWLGIARTYHFKKELEIVVRYKYLTTGIYRMWNVKTKVVPGNKGIAGKITKLFRKYLNNIAGNHDIEELQKTATLGDAHLLRKALMQKFTTFKTQSQNNCNIIYLRRIFFWSINVNTLRKCD